MKAKDLRDQSLEELESLYDDTCKKLFELKGLFRVDRESAKPSERKHCRKDIARLLTVITQKRRENQLKTG